MKISRVALLVALVFVAVASVVVSRSGSSAAETAEPETETEKVELGNCERGDSEALRELPGIPGYRCGSIEVPKFRQAPEMGSFEIGFAVRRRDASKQPAAGTIVAVEGGPGYSSTGTANAFQKLFASLLHDHDLVLIDQRGTGRSGPVRCPDLQDGTTPEQLALAECARRLGPDWQAYNTGASADDINAVREALELDKITLYGDSYGTYLGQSYAYRHPETLEALVLDGAYPVKGESPWYPSLITSGNRNMGTACRRSPDCHGDAVARIAEAATYMRRAGMNVGTLIDAIAGAAYGPPDSYVTIDAATSKLLEGKPRDWRRYNIQEITAARNRFSYSRPAEYIVGCNDYPMIWDRDASEPARRRQLQQAIRRFDDKPFEPFTAREVALASANGYLECLTWPKPTDLRVAPVEAGMEPTTAPVLVVNGELDDLTTPFEGRKVAGQFANAEHYIGRNAGHVAPLYYPKGPSAKKIRSFLRSVW